MDEKFVVLTLPKLHCFSSLLAIHCSACWYNIYVNSVGYFKMIIKGGTGNGERPRGTGK